MSYVITPPERPSLAVAGSDDRFPIRRVFCVGRNYAEHAREMGKDPDREPPFFFTKPADAAWDISETWPYPPETSNLHHEIEQVVAVGKEAVNVAPEDTDELIWGYAIGLDMTRRDLQGQAKEMGRPWDWGKAFDFSAPCGPVHRVSETGIMTSGSIWLDVNGEKRQRGDLADMIWPVRDILSIISRSMTLKPGDLVMTGTPAGVGAVSDGDVITAGVEGLGEIKTMVRA